MKLKNRIISVILVFLLGSTPVHAVSTNEIISTEEMQAFEYILALVQMDYYFESNDNNALRGALAEIMKNNPELLEDALTGALSTFDKNTRYIRAADYESTMESVDGNYTGIGVSITADNNRLVISNPFVGSPAEEAGLQGGDIILSIDGFDVTEAGVDEAVSRIRGEAGTSVQMQLQRDGMIIDASVTRREIRLSPINYYKLEDGIGYVQITAFNSNVKEYMDTALADLKSQGVDTIILDLRNNFGGEVTGAIAAASYFIPDNKLIMKQIYKNEQNNEEFYSTSDKVDFKPIVLVNENSASASEIVAGAIKDNKIGPLVGTVTYGKGTVQFVRQIFTGGAIWYTVAAYLTPNGAWIHEKGITPDYEVDNSYEKVDTKDIPPLKYSPLREGDTGAEVDALNKTLAAMGFGNMNTDGIYDSNTARVVSYLQEENGLYPYGVADINTQLLISDLLKDAMVLRDSQMEKAVELARETHNK